MSILSALKTKGAKGNNIEEAVKTLPIGGGSNNAFLVNYVYGDSTDTLDKTFAEIKDAFLNGKSIIVFKDESYDDPEAGARTQYKYGVLKSIDETINPEESHYLDINSMGTFIAYSVDDYPYVNE